MNSIEEFARRCKTATDCLPEARYREHLERLHQDMLNALEVGGPDVKKATRPKNSQDWEGMTGSCAYLLINRHADGWDDIELMMDEWLFANKQRKKQ